MPRLLGLLVVSLVACSSKPPPPAVAEPPLPIASSGVDAAAPRELDLGAVAAKSSVRWEPSEWVASEGGKGFVLSGRRIVRDASGERVVDAADPPLESVMKVPDKLGRGYVFLGPLDVYAAERFDAPLEPIVKRSDRAGRTFLGLGFGSIYLEYSGESTKRYELPSGKELPLDPPNAHRGMGSPDGFVVAAVKGTYAYAESPGAWKPLPLRGDPGDMFWHPKYGLVVDTANGFVAVERGGKTRATHRRGSIDFFSEVNAHEPFVEHAPPEIASIGLRSGAAGWDTQRLEGDVVALKRGCTKGKPNALCLQSRDGKWTEAWLPEAKVDWNFAIWAGQGDKLLGFVGVNGTCLLVAPLEKKHATMPCPGSQLSAERRGGASITRNGALRVYLGGISSLGVSIKEISLDGTIVEQEVPPFIQESIWGRRGLLVRPDRTLVETNDDGHTWVPVPSPVAGVARLTLMGGGTRGWLSTCDDRGCRFYDGAIRVGWALP